MSEFSGRPLADIPDLASRIPFFVNDRITQGGNSPPGWFIFKEDGQGKRAGEMNEYGIYHGYHLYFGFDGENKITTRIEAPTDDNPPNRNVISHLQFLLCSHNYLYNECHKFSNPSLEVIDKDLIISASILDPQIEKTFESYGNEYWMTIMKPIMQLFRQQE